jgi:hypothetical protein
MTGLGIILGALLSGVGVLALIGFFSMMPMGDHGMAEDGAGLRHYHTARKQKTAGWSCREYFADVYGLPSGAGL